MSKIPQGYFCFFISVNFFQTLRSTMEKLGNEMGYFDRLPDEVLMSILNRIDDLKFLCRATLVSKQFASMIYQITSVSLCLPSIDIESVESNSNVDRIFCSMAPVESEIVTRLIEPSTIQQKLKIMAFVENFKELESVFLEFACPKTPCSSPLLKWKAKLGKFEPIVESLISLLPTSMCEESGHESDQDQEYHSDIFFFQTSPGKNCSLYPLTCCVEWLVLVCSLIRRHHSLLSVTCTDFDRHGTFILEKEQIVEWRKKLLHDNKSFNVSSPRTVDMGWIPELHLPVAGYWMKDVFFVFMNFLAVPGPENDQELDKMMICEYGAEEKVIGEAVREALMNHMGSIIWELHPW